MVGGGYQLTMEPTVYYRLLWLQHITIVVTLCWLQQCHRPCALCEGTRNFDRDQDQGRDQKYDGTGTNARPEILRD